MRQFFYAIGNDSVNVPGHILYSVNVSSGKLQENAGRGWENKGKCRYKNINGWLSGEKGEKINRNVKMDRRESLLCREN